MNVFVAATDCSTPAAVTSGWDTASASGEPASFVSAAVSAPRPRELERGHDLGCLARLRDAEDERSREIDRRAIRRVQRGRGETGRERTAGLEQVAGVDRDVSDVPRATSTTRSTPPSRTAAASAAAGSATAASVAATAAGCSAISRRMCEVTAPPPRGRARACRRPRPRAREVARSGRGGDSVHARGERVVQRHRPGEVHAARDHELERPYRACATCARRRAPRPRAIVPAPPATPAPRRRRPRRHRARAARARRRRASPPRVIASKRSSTSRTPTASQNAPRERRVRARGLAHARARPQGMLDDRAGAAELAEAQGHRPRRLARTRCARRLPPPCRLRRRSPRDR